MKSPKIFQKPLVWIGLLIVLGAALALGIQQAMAQPAPAPAEQASPLHPTFALRDENGDNVLESGKPVSAIKTCGECHDTEYIASHSFHADLGLSEMTAPGETSSGRPWDTSNGLYGKWDPLTYRYLSPAGDERIDLTTEDWIKLNAERFVGGVPGTATGVVEMNCFVCHLTDPNNDARIAAIRAGDFAEASTATLIGSGIVEQSGGAWEWNEAAFNENGELQEPYIQVQDPDNSNCAQCHGVVHSASQTPLTLTGCSTENTQTATTGQVVAAQRISDSGMNISGKNELVRPWDIHAERQIECTDCHFSPNNPIHFNEALSDNPEHLTYDPRRLEIGEYLKQPNHEVARGQSAQFTVAPEYKGTMRRCEGCHDASKGHADWLPYIDRHMEVLACESCHIPQTFAPAIQQYDWTVLTANGQPLTECRGVEGDPNSLDSLVTGFNPVLLQRTNIDGGTLLAPYNLVTSFYWVYEDTNGNIRPVREADLNAAWFENGSYAPELLAAFDANGDAKLDALELRIDTDAKRDAVAARLSALGLNNPRIEGQVQPYSINHNVIDGEWAVNDCTACHNDQSRVTAGIELASYTPAGATPVMVGDANVSATGIFTTHDDGALFYSPSAEADGNYIFGHSSVWWVDLFGAVFFVGVLLGVSGHGTLRYVSSLRRPKTEPKTERVYIYKAYERFWHWLQTTTIVLLLFTGLIIHRPDIFGVFSFRYMVTLHNVLAAILAVNAALSLFYHLTTGEIRQYIPRPYGFFDEAIVQAKFYMQGIFKGEAHPFEKNPNQKMNPLQQATYFGILNVLLPLQGITGILMWGVQRWPGAADLFGGLPFLAPFHTLIAWTFAAFIIGHIYLTTTGATPLEAMRGMVTGWEELEVHEEHPQQTETETNAPEQSKEE